MQNEKHFLKQCLHPQCMCTQRTSTIHNHNEHPLCISSIIHLVTDLFISLSSLLFINIIITRIECLHKPALKRQRLFLLYSSLIHWIMNSFIFIQPLFIQSINQSPVHSDGFQSQFHSAQLYIISPHFHNSFSP